MLAEIISKYYSIPIEKLWKANDLDTVEARYVAWYLDKNVNKVSPEKQAKKLKLSFNNIYRGIGIIENNMKTDKYLREDIELLTEIIKCQK